MDANNTAATKQDLLDLETRMKQDLTQEMREMEDRLKEFTRDLQTETLRAFGTFAEQNSVRFRKLEADVSNINAEERLWKDIMERRLLEIEKRLLIDPPHAA